MQTWCKLIFSAVSLQGRRSLFYDEGLSKNIGHQGWPTAKIKKNTHWLKHPKAVPRKRNLDHNINDSKSSVWIFILKNIMVIRVVFISAFLAESLKANKTSKKDHSFYNTVSLKKPHSFY